MNRIGTVYLLNFFVYFFIKFLLVKWIMAHPVYNNVLHTHFEKFMRYNVTLFFHSNKNLANVTKTTTNQLNLFSLGLCLASEPISRSFHLIKRALWDHYLAYNPRFVFEDR